MPTWIRKIIQTATKHGKKEEEQKQPPDVEAKIAEQFIYQIRSETLREAAKAVQYILQYLKQHRDPAIEALYRAIMDIYSPSELHKLGYPEHIILIAMARALQKGIKDPVEIAKYALAYHSALQKQIRKIPHFEKLFANETLRHGGILSVHEILRHLAHALKKLERKGLIKPGTSNLFWEIQRRADLTYETWILRNLMAEEVVKKRIEVSKQLGIDIEPYLKEIEQELGLTQEKPQAKPTPGAAILAHPDRYPTLAQKVLLKALILGEHLRQPGGIHRDLYRALRNLLTGPETTHNFYPLILEWLERLEKGEKISPIRLLAEKLPLPPHIRGTLLSYAKQIEEGKPIEEIPPQEREAFKQAIEQAKQEIWRNPRRYEQALARIISGPNLGADYPKKTLTGILDDLAKIYTGEKEIADLDMERDALQILRLISRLEDRGNYIDPYEISERIRSIINQHIQDPLLRKAYNEVIDHYQATHHKIPRDRDYLQNLLRNEKELEEKLKQLQHGERNLTKNQIKRMRNLYRVLNLLTTHPTLKEMKEFYAELFNNRKVKVGDEEFYPVHGPLIPALAEDFGELRRADPEKYREKALEIAASYEPLIFIGPLLEREVTNTLMRNQERTIPLEEHNRFIENLANFQMRRPVPIREEG